MMSSAGEFDHHSSPRPLKRARKANGDHERTAIQEHHFVNHAPMDLTFIADGVNGKKSGGKKAPLSCCECRRLKLKCDRNFPCASCKKRGCAEICPDGVLVSGKGTRFILANTEQLHGKIQEMSDRIRHLEEALQSLHSQVSSNEGPHPLLRADFLGIKSTMGLYNSAQSHSTEPLLNGNTSTGSSVPIERPRVSGDRSPSEGTFAMSPVHAHSVQTDASDTELAAEIVRLSHNFPLSEGEPNIPLRDYIRSNLPSREDADYLWDQARRNALWQYNPHSSSTFYPNLAYHCYTAPTAELSPRRLALLLMILAVGCLVDLNRSPDHPDAERYHRLARASLCEVSVMEETNVETITVLFYEIWYLLVFSDKKKAAGYAWGLMGLTAKLAQSIGLHRNGGKSKVIPEEVEKRRSLFWELLYLDARLSLSLGRPPSLTITHMDCPRPSYLPDDPYNLSESLHSYQEWKHDCYLHCLAPVIDVISQPNINYSTVLELDRRIRDFYVPAALRDKDATNRTVVVQRASLSTALEAVLLQLHRQFFTRALSGPEEGFNRRHKFAPSVVAVFLSASRMIAAVQDLYNHEPHLAARILGYWSNAFSATVALCILVSRAPFTCLSPAALQELERARVLFRDAKETCPRAMQVIPILEAMIDKANLIYNRWSNGQELPTVLRHITDDTQVSDSSNLATYSPQMNPADAYMQSQQLSPPPQQSDTFAQAHQSLAQCIAEVHQRAKALFPLRKPCQCSSSVKKSCPPSHDWSPPPAISNQSAPVLPEVPPPLHFMPPAEAGYVGLPTHAAANHDYSRQPIRSSQTHYGTMSLYGEGLYTNTVLPVNGHAIPSPNTLSPTSKMAVVDTINFELGALNSNNDQNWMAFF
ncbi:fungal-specific transcription factor domain-containing protein [Crepidotus variabilis]|uniref:Fungal-specific transcription factor domain-containing protein n=1 Tax=Crepidotus variabilis TaxID=179855 RepID=A0A9P6JKI9_9AGAR|nr:fungal-specific transcription factor domain-containing protein [Crepidotus variabilis]